MNRSRLPRIAAARPPRTYRLPALAALLALSCPALAADPLETEIQQLVNQYRTTYKIPGLTVSVTRDGMELFAKGYGTAGDTTTMNADTRTMIGSVTKAAVTGPSGYQALAQSPSYSLASRLYGTGAVFGQKFATDLTVGVQRHTPIVGIGINKDNKVHTWYANGTVSIGATNHLDQYEPPVPYSLPAGRKPADIVGMSIASNGMVYTWYRKGGELTRSIGTATDLEQYEKQTTSCKVDNPAPDCKDIALSGGRSVYNIVGIGIAKSNDHVYTWYDDGTYSVGYSLDLDYHAAPKPFATPAGLTPYDIREIDIAGNDRVYAWYRNGKASSGYSAKLDHYLAPYAYQVPESGYSGDNWYAWYADMTLQDLLRHEAGFTHSGDLAGAAVMFGKDVEDVTYEEAHRYMLRTRPLLAAPGTKYNYSNHGFGLWTLIMPVITGKPFLDYARDNYLKPMGMDKRVVVASATPAANDAVGYTLDGNGNYKALPFKETSSPAAGGFRASARSLTRISSSLLAQWGWGELRNMGWLSAGDGRLGHEGALDGGNALVLLYPDGYKTDGGLDMTGIHVAIAANRWNNDAADYALAEEIATKVAAAK